MRKMNLTFRLLLPGLIVTGLFGCGDEDPTGIDIGDLAGTYTATRFEFRSVADPLTTYDLVADGGATFQFTIESDGDFALAGQIPGSPDEIDSGTVSIDGDEITLSGGDPITGTFTLSGPTLTIDIPAGSAEYDFDDNGSDDPASAQLVFVAGVQTTGL